MSQFSRSLDVYQGFNFKKDKQSRVGFITSMKVGTKELEADLTTIADPEQPTKKLKVVSVLNHFLWDTGATDAMYFSGQISTKNQQALSLLVLNDLTSIAVEFEYTLYQYDPLEKKYFKSSFHAKKLMGLVEKSGDDLKLAVEDDPSSEVKSPQNFTFQIGITPQSQEQQVTLAVATQMKVEKKWGSKSN
ncbi:hypothetical protein HPC49_12430 [Pyxidicoccus fallax]|uniref:Uncharacterized protein n=1 Tax=Pyxidicoccus fallax TaxID=394095 RepID=A0A848LLL7_9BACT|nr:hypothetical protein [Pyxidicoccus fallax]NMO18636.1 hypothetical protein [Pyxidicoccus fallax]NPC79041.1 hypothetical protein [Pyxidicoccus fallax]